MHNLLETNSIAQIGIIVRDIEKTAASWSRIFGHAMPVIIVTDTVDIAHTEYAGKPTPARAKLAFFHFDNIDVELIEPIGSPSTWNDQLQAHGDSLHHVAFQIKGMEHLQGELARNKIPLVQRGDYTGGRYAYVDSMGELGLILELLEND